MISEWKGQKLACRSLKGSRWFKKNKQKEKVGLAAISRKEAFFPLAFEKGEDI
jgi:hypothetical protein